MSTSTREALEQIKAMFRVNNGHAGLPGNLCVGDIYKIADAALSSPAPAETASERKQISAIAKALAWEKPYQASLVTRVEALIAERGSLTTERDQLRAALSSPAPDRLSEEERRAVENLRTHQEQCDMDGVMVKVSRQAVDETLAIIDRLSCQPEAEPAAWGDSEGRERPIDAGAMKQLRLNPTTETFWSRFSIPLHTSPHLDRERLARTLYRRLVLNPPADFDDASADLQNEWLQLADAIMRETR